VATFLASKDVNERLAAASLAVVLGDEDAGFAVLGRDAGMNAVTMHEAAQLLTWPPATKRRFELFELLLAKADDPEKLASLVAGVGETKAPAAIPRLWQLVDAGRTDSHNLGAFQKSLWQLYQNSSSDSNLVADFLGALLRANIEPNDKVEAIKAAPEKLSDGPRQRIERDVAPRLAKGSEDARILALTLLAGVNGAAAHAKVTEFLGDTSIKPAFRRDLIQLEVNLLADRDATKKAVALLGDGDPKIRQFALAWVASDFAHRYDLHELRGGMLETRLDPNQRHRYREQSRFPAIPYDLKAEALLPFLTDDDPGAVATAGLLLVALGRSEGWEPLFEQWRQKGPTSPYTQHVYTAIALRNDAEQVATLEAIYEWMQKSYGKNANYMYQPFYWTIRIMTGPEVLKLRKRIRDDVGMSNL
jgi:hypothetical protein